jgi:hypothetical protein
LNKSLLIGLWLVLGLSGGLLGWLNFGPVGGLVAVLFGVLVFGLSYGNIETRGFPNEGIHRSARNACVVGSVAGSLLGLVSVLGGGVVAGVVVGLFSGLAVGRQTEGEACLRHIVLRLALIRTRSTPWNYVRFLDYAAERILLRKVGGGYAFIHRMLLEYFAARYVEFSPEGSAAAKPSPVQPDDHRG